MKTGVLLLLAGLAITFGSAGIVDGLEKNLAFQTFYSTVSAALGIIGLIVGLATQ